MPFYTTFGEAFFISVGTMIVGLIGLSIKYCLKSKCEHFALCCGLITIDRRVDLEVEEELKQMELGLESEDAKDEGDAEEKAGMTIDLSKMGMKKK